MATFLALCRAGPSALDLRLSDIGCRLGLPGAGWADAGQRVVLAGIPVPLSELQELGEMAVRGEPGPPLVTVVAQDPESVVFRIMADTPDPQLAGRFRRRLTTHLLQFPHLGLAGRVDGPVRSAGCDT